MNSTTKLAEIRTDLANQRTLLAYVRTSLAFFVAAAGLLKLYTGVQIQLIAIALVTFGIMSALAGYGSFKRNDALINITLYEIERD
ncbi:MAG: DUF202 domain-containing protein [Cyanobacteria bacterium J06648_11]